jgi:hypothetical protein
MAEESDAANRVVERVRTAFPAEAQAVDAVLLQDGFVPLEAPNIWVERFSQRTTDALKGGDTARAGEHLKFISHMLDGADEPTIRCIDVSYVESLMWDIKDVKRKAEGWKLVPANLRQLYIAMWGEQPFMGKTK